MVAGYSFQTIAIIALGFFGKCRLGNISANLPFSIVLPPKPWYKN
jgi:hypothetical protein